MLLSGQPGKSISSFPKFAKSNNDLVGFQVCASCFL